MSEIVDTCKQSMEKRLKAFDGELKQVRTGRATISALDNVRVDYYGTPTPLNQVATLTTPDARTIAISPFEKKLIQDIEKAIMKADIGVNPTNDGNLIRLPFPALTEERRKDIAKGLKKIAEDARVSIRNIRRDINEEIKKQEKAKTVTEDGTRQLQDQIQKLTDGSIKAIDDKVVVKEKEIMTI